MIFIIVALFTGYKLTAERGDSVSFCETVFRHSQTDFESWRACLFAGIFHEIHIDDIAGHAGGNTRYYGMRPDR